MEQEAAESCCLKLSLIPIFSGTLISSLHLHTCLILSHSFIHSFIPPSSRICSQSQQTGWILDPDPKAPTWAHFQPCVCRKAFPEEAFQREQDAHTWLCFGESWNDPWSKSLLWSRILSCFYPGAAPPNPWPPPGDYFHFSKTEETEQRNAPGKILAHKVPEP